MLLTKDFLKEQALSALKINGNIRKNMCDVVSNELSVNLDFEFNIDTYSPIYAPVNGRKHFVCLVDSNDTQFTNEDGFVIIDATIKQFDEHKYPDVAIIPPNDNRRNWYDSIEIPK